MLFHIRLCKEAETGPYMINMTCEGRNHHLYIPVTSIICSNTFHAHGKLPILFLYAILSHM